MTPLLPLRGASDRTASSTACAATPLLGGSDRFLPASDISPGAADRVDTDGATDTDAAVGYEEEYDDEDVGTYTDGGERPAGTISGGEDLPSSCAPTGYSSEGGAREVPRLPRPSHHASRPLLSFGGPTSRRQTASSRNRRPSRERIVPARSVHSSRSRSMNEPSPNGHPRDALDAARARCSERTPPATDPLLWTGGSPPPVTPSAAGPFGLPPLLALPERTGSNTTRSEHRILRCTSYCVALGLDLLKLYHRLCEGGGLPCRMHKDGLNAVLHCIEHASDERDAHSFFFS